MQHLKNWIDLTHPLSPDIPTWNGSCGFCLEIKKDYDRDFRVQQIKMHAGAGTHMDAPSHRFEGGKSIADIPLKELIAPISLIEVSQKADADYKISVEDIKEYEKTYCPIPKNALLIGHTGWHRFWHSPDAYRNLDKEGRMRFPSFSIEAIEYVLEREIVGIAIDTMSPDCLDPSFAVHRSLLSKDKYIIENIADCSLVPPSGSYAIALPLKAQNASECPIRILAVY